MYKWLKVSESHSMSFTQNILQTREGSYAVWRPAAAISAPNSGVAFTGEAGCEAGYAFGYDMETNKVRDTWYKTCFVTGVSEARADKPQALHVEGPPTAAGQQGCDAGYAAGYAVRRR